VIKALTASVAGGWGGDERGNEKEWLELKVVFVQQGGKTLGKAPRD
jgi:hypothetical protein